jgi:hypothetical protein
MKHIYFTLIILSIISCRKDEEGGHNMCEGDKVYQPISPQMLIAKYKVGTYWIFVDSVSNIQDSVYVNSISESNLYDGCTHTYRVYDYSLRSSPTSEFNSYRIVTGSLFKNSTGLNDGTLIYSQYFHTTTYNSVTFLDSFFVYDRYYYNLSQTTVFNDPTYSNNKVVYYINTEFGFLRKDIFDSNSNLISKKLLVRKNIVR